MENNQSRRNFIKGALGAGIAVAGANLVESCSLFPMALHKPVYNAKGLPTAVLGKTGIPVPRLAVGLGSRFCTIENPEKALELLNFTLDNGLYYWDTAWVYENTKLGITSEARLGEVVKTRRKEIFLSTKVTSRDPDEAMRQIETSLKRLQTDHVDMLKIHDVQNDKDVEKLSGKGNLIDILHRLKEQGVTRFIGFSGHTEAGAMKAMAQRGDFDSMLIAMNHWNSYRELRQEIAIPAAREKGLGIMLMKVVRPKETIKELAAADLIRYALSLPDAHGLVLGMDSLEIVKSNLDILRNFKPMEKEMMNRLAQQLSPYYNHRNLPWMEHGYQDGMWA